MGRCLSENTLQALVAGLLPGDALAHAHEHIERCASCRALVVELARDSHTEVMASAATAPMAAAPAIGDFAPVPRCVAKRFEIIRPLGRGGMGVVYEALDRERGARIALKTLQHVSADALLRFKNEFRAVQDVQHPNLITLGELIEDRGQWWLTMELVDGVEFLDHVRPGGTLDEARLRAALVQLASALQALHARGLVHRDVKPNNVLVTPAGRVVLLDFGLVVHVDQSESNVVGTPAYMAPEQCLVQEVGTPADWYGVGALLYEALTGALPFDGPPLQVLKAKQEILPRRPRELAGAPADLDALCMELLAVDPAARPDAATVLARVEPTASRTAPATAAVPLFVGRARELDILANAFARTRAGKEAIVLVRGESGIGKSALVRHFTDDLRRREPTVVVLAGKCYQRETVPYKAFDGVVDALARHLRKLRSEAAAVLPRRAVLLVQAFPVLARVPALRALPADDALDPKELRVRAFAAMRELLGRLAERAPLVLCIDDLQWADADSLELLGYVMAPPEAPPLLLIMTSRPHRTVATDANMEAGMVRLRELPSLRMLELDRLSRDEATRLVEHLLVETPVGRASAKSVADEAEGHPLFIEALVHFAARDPAARPGIHLTDVLWARVSALNQPARQLLFLVAVAGWPLSFEFVVAMAILPAGELDTAIAWLRQAHLVRLADGTGKGVLEPYHDRVREAVLDHLDEETRKQCHRALAEALLHMEAVGRVREALPPHGETAARDTQEPPSSSNAWWDAEAIAVHLHGAGELAQAGHYMAMAADKAAEAFAFDRAARLYRQALELHTQAGEPPGVVEARQQITRYARIGDVSIAYQTFGSGATDIVVVPAWISHCEVGWRLSAYARFFTQLGRCARVTLFDKRGTGMSDRMSVELPLEERMQDLPAVLDAIGCDSAVLFGTQEGGALASMYAALHPDRVRGLVLYGTGRKLVSAPDYPHGIPPEHFEDICQAISSAWGSPLFAELAAPSCATEPAFTSWWADYLRHGATPTAAVSLIRMNATMDIDAALPAISTPTLVIHRTGDRMMAVGGGRYVAERITGARYLELPGDDHLPWIGDSEAIVRAIEDFLARIHEESQPRKSLVSVLAVEATSPDVVIQMEQELARLGGRSIMAQPQQSLSRVVEMDGPVAGLRCAEVLRQQQHIRRALVLSAVYMEGLAADQQPTGLALAALQRVPEGALAATLPTLSLAGGARIRIRDEAVGTIPGGLALCVVESVES